MRGGVWIIDTETGKRVEGKRDDNTSAPKPTKQPTKKKASAKKAEE